MKKAATENRETPVANKTVVSTLAINHRVALAKKKIETETLAQMDETVISEARLSLAIVFQAMEDLYLNGISEVDRAMAIVYLYSSKIKELEEMNIDTAWVQRILKDMDILDVADPEPYVRACLIVQLESSRPYSKGAANGLIKFVPVCECVEDQFLDYMTNNNPKAA